MVRALWRGPVGEESLMDWGFVLMPTVRQSEFLEEYPWIPELTS